MKRVSTWVLILTYFFDLPVIPFRLETGGVGFINPAKISRLTMYPAYQRGRQDRPASGFAAMRSAVKSSFEWHGCKDSNRFATNYDARTNQSKHRRTAKWNAD